MVKVGSCNADPEVALAAEKLGGFLRVVAKGNEDWHCSSEKTIFTRRGSKFLKARS